MPIHCTSTTCTFFPYQHPSELSALPTVGNSSTFQETFMFEQSQGTLQFGSTPRGTFLCKWHTVWGLHGRSTRTQHILPIYSFRAYSLGILGVRLCPVGRLAGGCERGVEVWREGQGEGSAPLSS